MISDIIRSQNIVKNRVSEIKQLEIDYSKQQELIYNTNFQTQQIEKN